MARQVAVVLVAAGCSLRDPSLIAGLALAYLLLWLDIHLQLQRLGHVTTSPSASHIYAFPVQQLLATWKRAAVRLSDLYR